MKTIFRLYTYFTIITLISSIYSEAKQSFVRSIQTVSMHVQTEKHGSNAVQGLAPMEHLTFKNIQWYFWGKIEQRTNQTLSFAQSISLNDLTPVYFHKKSISWQAFPYAITYRQSALHYKLVHEIKLGQVRISLTLAESYYRQLYLSQL